MKKLDTILVLLLMSQFSLANDTYEEPLIDVAQEEIPQNIDVQKPEWENNYQVVEPDQRELASEREEELYNQENLPPVDPAFIEQDLNRNPSSDQVVPQPYQYDPARDDENF